MALVTDTIAIDQGSDWAAIYAYATQSVSATGVLGAVAPVDLTGWTARAQVRRKLGSATVYARWSTVTSEVRDGPITLTSDGEVILELDAAVTEAMSWASLTRSYPWDLVLIDPDGTVVRLVEGTAQLRPEITPAGVTPGTGGAGMVLGGAQSTTGPTSGLGGTVLVHRATPVQAVVARIGAPGPPGKDASYAAPLARVAVLDATAPIPPGLPARTVILRRP